jgi:hypothetical protein
MKLYLRRLGVLVAAVVAAVCLAYWCLRPKLYIGEYVIVNDSEVELPVFSTCDEFYLVCGTLSPTPSFPGYTVHGFYRIVSDKNKADITVRRRFKVQGHDLFDAWWEIRRVSKTGLGIKLGEVFSKDLLVHNFKATDASSVNRLSESECVISWAHHKDRSDGIVLHPHREFIAVSKTLAELKHRFPISKIQPNFRWQNVDTVSLDEEPTVK